MKHVFLFNPENLPESRAAQWRRKFFSVKVADDFF
jgi:hypothetical protein